MKRARLLLVALVVLNVGYFAWTRGALAMFGTAPASLSEREPQRMAQQIRPGALQIRKESDLVAPKPAPAPAPPPVAGASPSDQAPPAAPAAPAAPSVSSAEHEGL